MPLQATSGAASYDAFGGGVPVVPAYIEEVFSTWLYNGTGSAQTITNGIDFSTKGGLLWFKARNDTRNNWLYDTTRSIANGLRSDSNTAATSTPNALTAFNNNGFSIGTSGNINTSGNTLVSWSFRKQPKFFDVVTWTGTGANPQIIPHNLGSVPGCIIVKVTNDIDEWIVYHRTLANTQFLILNTTAAAANGSTGPWGATTPTSTQFTVGSYANSVGLTYVAYLFAHDAGGFGLTGTDNVISCGSYTGTGTAGLQINLGYEPQWFMVKRTDSTADWFLSDILRGMPIGDTDRILYPNLTAAEDPVGNIFAPTATGLTITNGGFGPVNASGGNYIYIAIRRGPMAVPTDATKVFTPATRTGTGAAATVTSAGFPIDLIFSGGRSENRGFNWDDRLNGAQQSLRAFSTSAYTSDTQGVTGFDTMSGMRLGTGSTFGGGYNVNAELYVYEMLRRAPKFFDIVCYTGTGSATTQTHNLAAVPELMIVKSTSAAGAWDTYCSALANTEYVVLNDTAAKATGTTRWNSTTPTSSVFTVGTSSTTNGSGVTYVAYLFSTCAGVSKVGSYTGNGTTQTINCGFTGGARFVLIKRTDATGDWYVYDTARGMTVLTDPYMLMNTADLEVATLGSVTTVSTGFALNSTILAAINVNGGSYIFLAIA